MRFLLPSLLGVLGVCSCSGGAHQIEIGAPPAKMTQGTFAGPLCSGASCKCRDASAPGDGGAGVPTDGTKRFEIRMTSAQQLWIKIRDNEMYKSAERPEECFYIDLPAGESVVEMRASEPNGVAAEWTIRELGTQTKSWYDTFTFNCGQPGVCSFDELREKKADYTDPKRDRCGSVKAKSLVWDTGRSPDQLHPSELAVKVTLDVYKFVPDRPHGSDCGKKQAAEHDEDNPKM
ncbi:MAG: hypothetical protein HOV81_18315 [Kofleriaceae bacterium]|nr:hypothetical protein [Kofleriaceae bacterium]